MWVQRGTRERLDSGAGYVLDPGAHNNCDNMGRAELGKARNQIWPTEPLPESSSTRPCSTSLELFLVQVKAGGEASMGGWVCGHLSLLG